MKRSGVVQGMLLALLVVPLMTARARATECPGLSDNEHQCWKSLSGPNYSQVAVGKPRNGVGIACAVKSPSGDSWGGSVECYAPVGSSGAAIKGIGGELAQNPGPFSSTDPSRRIVSMAIAPGPFPLAANFVKIYALRSDGVIFVAVNPWPLGTDPRILFNTQLTGTPAGLRAISYVSGIGLLGVTTSNSLFGPDSNGNWTWMSDSVVVVANNSFEAYGIALSGNAGTVVSLVNVKAGTAPPSLPGSLAGAQSDPNSSFAKLGRDMPLSFGSATGYSILPGNCHSGTSTPCLMRTTRTNSFWSSWAQYSTGTMSPNPSYAMPWSIQDGAPMRGVPGEIWVIAGAFHLKFWVP
jgi:hypothetical protein